MADITYRGNLKTASFPFLSELFGRTVIVKQYDQNFVSGLAAKESIDSSLGIPQLYYCHNVIPTDTGYKSIAYDTHTPATFPEATGFRKRVTVRDGDGNSAQLAITDLGNLYVMPEGTSTWISPVGAPLASTIAGKRLTAAFVSGTTYIYFSGVGCYSYDFASNTLSSVTLTGLTASDILGVVGNKGYLLAYTASELAWSSTVDPTDFVPSLVTGAGGGAVESAKGSIITIESVYGGMIIFTETNAIAGIASGNSRYPYNFTEITGAGGLQDSDFVTSDINSGSLYAYTTCGLQSISLRQAQVVFPEVTDFLSGSLLEDYNETTDELVTTSFSGSVLQKKFTVVASRYLIISYGISSLTHALYYDLSYKQWGRLKVSHTDCFEFDRSDTEIPKKSIAFLGSGGSIQVLNSDINASNASGVMLLGKFQFVRSRLITLQGVEFENVNQSDTFSLLDLPSLDGKNFSSIKTGYLQQSSGKVRSYKFHTTGINHTVVCKGAFNATTITLTFNINGRR